MGRAYPPAVNILLLMASATLTASPVPPDDITRALWRHQFGTARISNGACAYSVLERANTHLSVYGACGTFKKVNGRLVMQSGAVLPYRLDVNAAGAITQVRVPRDGAAYQGDLGRLFSRAARAKLTAAERGRLVQRLYQLAGQG